MDIELENGIGYYWADHITEKSHANCKIGNTSVVIAGTKEAKKQVQAKFIVRAAWDPVQEGGPYQTAVPNGVMYRTATKVTQRTKLGRFFGEDVYSPDSATEYLCIVKFIITDTEEQLPVTGKKGDRTEKPVQGRRSWARQK